MSNSLKWVKYIFEWRFLPVRFQQWLFGTGTRAVEFVSGCSMIGYALVFAFSPNDIYSWPIYYKFKDISEFTLILVFGGVGVLQLQRCTGRHSRGKCCRVICFWYQHLSGI